MFFIPIIEKRGLVGLAADLDLPVKNVRRWIDEDSIPAAWWMRIAAVGIATLEELGAAAEARAQAKNAPATSDNQGEAAA